MSPREGACWERGCALSSHACPELPITEDGGLKGWAPSASYYRRTEQSVKYTHVAPHVLQNPIWKTCTSSRVLCAFVSFDYPCSPQSKLLCSQAARIKTPTQNLSASHGQSASRVLFFDIVSRKRVHSVCRRLCWRLDCWLTERCLWPRQRRHLQLRNVPLHNVCRCKRLPL